MDLPSPHQAPRGPMTRVRAKAIEDKVNSLLSELCLPTHETWLLPHSETLCVIRFLEASHGTATYKSQDGEDPKHDGQEEELPWKRQASDDRPSPDIRRMPRHGRPSFPDVRYFATRTKSTDARSGPDDRTTCIRAEFTDDRRPPDVRQVPGTGQPKPTGRPAPPVQSQNVGCPTPSGRPDPRERPDVRPRPDVRHYLCAAGPLALYPSPTYPFVA